MTVGKKQVYASERKDRKRQNRKHWVVYWNVIPNKREELKKWVKRNWVEIGERAPEKKGVKKCSSTERTANDVRKDNDRDGVRRGRGCDKWEEKEL